MTRSAPNSFVLLRQGWVRAVGRLALVVGLCATSGNALVDSQARPSEYDVKAAYLLNFGKFVRAPQRTPAREQFDICIIGPDPIGHALDSLARGEEIDGRPVRVRRMNDAADARTCDVAYITTGDTARIDSELAVLRNSDVLTVGDAPSFLDRGGMVQFVMAGRHVRFSVNLNAVRRTHLVLSSELLRVALSVIGSGEAKR